MVDQKSEKISLQCGGKSKEHMCVLANLKVSQNLKTRTDGRKFIVARERNRNMVAYPVHVQDHMRRVSFCQNAFQKGNHQSQHFLPRLRRQAACLTLWLLSQFQSTAAEPDWRIWLEAKFLAPPVSSLIPQAQRTVLAAGRWTGTELLAFTAKDWKNTGLSWEKLDAEARRAASIELKHLVPTYKRDRREVIEYAELFSPEGYVPSAILAPELGDTFADTLGEVLLFAVPSRHRAFIFPQLGGDTSKYSGLVWGAYRETSVPVSVELFEWRNGTIRAIGLFER